MVSDEIRKNLQDIVGGALIEGKTDRCTAIRNLLCESFDASPTAKSEFESKSIIKERQSAYLKACTEFGLALEDMHDENVIAKEDVLFFVDTVFYVMSESK